MIKSSMSHWHQIWNILSHFAFLYDVKSRSWSCVRHYQLVTNCQLLYEVPVYSHWTRAETTFHYCWRVKSRFKLSPNLWSLRSPGIDSWAPYKLYTYELWFDWNPHPPHATHWLTTRWSGVAAHWSHKIRLWPLVWNTETVLLSFSGFKESISPAYVARARIFKLLRSPRTDSKEPIPPGCVAWRGPVRQPYSYSVPSPHRLFENSSSGYDFLLYRPESSQQEQAAL